MADTHTIRESAPPVSKDDLAEARVAGDSVALRELARRARREHMHPWTIANYSGYAESTVRRWSDDG